MIRPQDDHLLGDMLTTFRRSLHAVPEPAHEESLTSTIVSGFLSHYAPDELITEIGGHGLAAVFAGDSDGPTVLVRSELDALGCATAGTLSERASHRCGHDGHMAIASGLAPRFAHRRPSRGRLVLLYQPAEETGEGARAVIEDPRFASIRPDYAMALHNLPGVPHDTVVLRRGTFACASVGLVLSLHGVAGHAAEPRLARSPRAVLAGLLTELADLDRPDEQGLRMLTLTHAQLGTPSFGITPGDATLYCTLRATSLADLEALKSDALATADRLAAGSGIGIEVHWFDEFPATVSDDRLVDLLARTAKAHDVEVRESEWPMRWSEDFGHFAELCPSLYFGLGIGPSAPLHNADYTFHDPAILTGVALFEGMVRQLLDT